MKSLAVLLFALLELKAQNTKEPINSTHIGLSGFSSRSVYSFDTSHETFNPSALIMKNQKIYEEEQSSQIKSDRQFSDFISSTSSENMKYRNKKDEYYYNSNQNVFDNEASGEKLPANENEVTEKLPTYGVNVEYHAVTKSSQDIAKEKKINHEVKFERQRENLSETLYRCDFATKVSDYLKYSEKVISINFDDSKNNEYYFNKANSNDSPKIFFVVTHDLYETNAKGLVEGVTYKGKISLRCFLSCKLPVENI